MMSLEKSARCLYTKQPSYFLKCFYKLTSDLICLIKKKKNSPNQQDEVLTEGAV